jgi:SP family general alpha glucoside:H+ symporter-like MFS transporter
VSICIKLFGNGSDNSGIVGETSSTRLRAKTVALSRNFYYLWVVFSNVISPYMLNPTKWNLQGKTNFVWAPLATLCLVWGYFRLPEMKVSCNRLHTCKAHADAQNRTFYELDVLFNQKVSARKFKGAVVETDESGVDSVRYT